MVMVFGMGDLLSFSVPQFGPAGASLMNNTDFLRGRSSFFWQEMNVRPQSEVLASRR